MQKGRIPNWKCGPSLKKCRATLTRRADFSLVVVLVHGFLDPDNADGQDPCEIDENQGYADKSSTGAVSHPGKQFTNHVIPPRSTRLWLEKMYVLCLFGKEMSTPFR
jgi:hypothetical protein